MERESFWAERNGYNIHFIYLRPTPDMNSINIRLAECDKLSLPAHEMNNHPKVIINRNFIVQPENTQRRMQEFIY